MSPPNAKLPIRKTPIFTPYVIVWTMLGMIGFGYLSLAFMAPDVLEDLVPSVMREASNETSIAATSRVATEVASLHDMIAQIQLDIAKLKTDVSNQAEVSKTVETQLVALQDRVKANEPPVQAQAAPEPEPTPAQKAERATTAAAPADKDQPAGKAPPAAPSKVINADREKDKATPLVTGSVNSAAAPAEGINFGPAVVKPAPKPIGLRLGAGATVDSLRLNWSLLTDRHAEALGKLEPRVIADAIGGVATYDLVAGPVKSKADAAKICKELIADDIPCKVGDFKGDAL